MLLFKPHTVTVRPYTDGPQSKAPMKGAATSVLGQLTPKTPAATYQSWGVDTDLPHELYCELEDARLFKVGYKVSFDSREFSVLAGPIRFQVGLSADYAKVLLGEQLIKSEGA